MNKVMLIGNVGREPEIKYYEADQCVASFTLATTERGYTLPNGTVVPDHTDWHNIVLFKALAKYAESIFIKAINFILRGVCVIVLMMIRKVCVVMLQRFMVTTLNGFPHPVNLKVCLERK